MTTFVTGSGETKRMNVKETEAYKEANPTIADKVLGVTIEGGIRMVYLRGAEAGAAHRNGYEGHQRTNTSRGGSHSDPTANSAIGNIEPTTKGSKNKKESDAARKAISNGASLYDILTGQA